MSEGAKRMFAVWVQTSVLVGVLVGILLNPSAFFSNPLVPLAAMGISMLVLFPIFFVIYCMQEASK